MPGVTTLRTYERGWLRFDLIAGLVLAAILVPQGMAYAELAGLPPVTGLYTTIACLVAYAVFGPSKVLVLGPDSSVSPLILASITPLLVVGDPGSAIVLAGMLAVLVGAIEIGLGVAKLGFVADLLSSEVRVGYLNGLAITIIVGQLPKLFGFSVDADGFVDEVRGFVEGLSGRNSVTLATGLCVAAPPLQPSGGARRRAATRRCARRRSCPRSQLTCRSRALPTCRRGWCRPTRWV